MQLDRIIQSLALLSFSSKILVYIVFVIHPCMVRQFSNVAYSYSGGSSFIIVDNLVTIQPLINFFSRPAVCGPFLLGSPQGVETRTFCFKIYVICVPYWVLPGETGQQKVRVFRGLYGPIKQLGNNLLVLYLIVRFIIDSFQPFRFTRGDGNVRKPTVFSSTVPVFNAIVSDNNITGF